MNIHALMSRKTAKQSDALRCDVCGRFINYADLDAGRAVRHMLTPDSDRSREEWETLCRDHKDAP